MKVQHLQQFNTKGRQALSVPLINSGTNVYPWLRSLQQCMQLQRAYHRNISGWLLVHMAAVVYYVIRLICKLWIGVSKKPSKR